ncbi:MAG: C39 family peptidase [Brevefilum sp.]
MRKKRWDIPQKKNMRGLKVLVTLLLGGVLLIIVYFLPPVHVRLAPRLNTIRAEIYYFFNPPERISFSPTQQAEMDDIVSKTRTAMAPTPTATIEPSITPTDYQSPTPTETPAPTFTATPIPSQMKLDGVVWENQKLYNNYCGPANVSMALSYWEWEGDQTVTGPWLKPNPEDRNIMPYEMADYVRQETHLDVILRYGGDLETIKKFIAAGFPVIIERGFQEEVPNDYWMGHYNVIVGYDDFEQEFIIQDSYVGENYKRPYDFIYRHWRAFNFVYLVVFPGEQYNEIQDILGPHIDETYNIQETARRALEETEQLEGNNLFFAWFNYGASLRLLNDYYGAAQAFDTAYTLLEEMYEGLDPLYRILWYRTDPYFAYFYTERYEDVLTLTKKTLNSSFVPAIEESWVWQGRAKAKLGDTEGAIKDFRTALEWHPGWGIAEQELRNLGVEP